MSEPLIRRVLPQDRDALATLSEVTFRETFIDDFAIAYPEPDLTLFVSRTYGREPTRRLIADKSRAVWIAEMNGGAVAYAVAGPCALPYPEARPEHGELKRLYVLRAYQGLGLGQRLLSTALDWLERDGPKPLWIGVWSGNAKARAFYARHGFVKFGDHTFAVGRWLDQEISMRRG